MPTVAVKQTPHVKAALKYCEDVSAGKILACEYTRLACARQLRDLDEFRGREDIFYWDAAAAERVCEIVQKFPHIKGVWAQARKRLELEPWQQFIVSTVFGWKTTAAETRRFRVSYVEVPRKNAKSTLTSALGNYLLACDGEAGSYVVSVANTQAQARLVFDDAQRMARRETGFLHAFGVEVMAHLIAQPGTASKFEPLSAEYSNLDGLNVHAALVDELHAHPSRGLWDILETATGSRSQPLIWAITTAGVNRASVCYDQRSHLIDILNQRVQDDSYFGVIYTLDEGDDPWLEDNWRKANPNYGISIYPESLRSEAARAQVMPSMQSAFFTKHLNLWVNADVTWLPHGAWAKCKDLSLTLEDFAGEPCFIGVDLALTNDVAAVVVLFPPNADREFYAVFGRYYLPSETIQKAQNGHFQAWETEGLLIATPGAVTDFDYILEDLLDIAERFEVQEVVSDPWKNLPLVNALQKAGFPRPVVNLRCNASNMTPSMLGLEGLVTGGKIRHDGDPILDWMVGNVVCHRSGREGTMQPRKADEADKIDGAVALMLAVNRAQRFAQADEGTLVWGL